MLPALDIHGHGPCSLCGKVEDTTRVDGAPLCIDCLEEKRLCVRCGKAVEENSAQIWCEPCLDDYLRAQFKKTV